MRQRPRREWVRFYLLLAEPDQATKGCRFVPTAELKSTMDHRGCRALLVSTNIQAAVRLT